MPPSLLDSQFATIEEPTADEHVVVIDINTPVNQVVATIADRLRISPESRISRIMTPIKLLISDVDGTLVTKDKRLTPASIEAVRELRARGIQFSVTSSRPPFGMRMLREPLNLDLPMGAFNGSSIVRPDLTVDEQQTISAQRRHHQSRAVRALWR